MQGLSIYPSEHLYVLVQCLKSEIVVNDFYRPAFFVAKMLFTGLFIHILMTLISAKTRTFPQLSPRPKAQKRPQSVEVSQ